MFRLAVAILTAILFASSAFAKVGTPTGPVLLTVSGAISAQSGDGSVQLDLDALRQLDWIEIQTFTPFTDGLQTFAGPTLASLMQAVGAQGDVIEARAINDYTVEVNLPMAIGHGAILAIEHNGVAMRIRDKGPVWLIFPQDEAGALMKQFESQMIWQLSDITVR